MGVRRTAVAWAAALVVSCGLLALPLVALAATSAVTIQNSAFNPPTTPIRVGDKVTWTNRDAFSHTSTSDTGAWDSSVITAGGSFSFTFTSAGTFAYHCSIHTFMHGTVAVMAASTPPPPPPPTTAPPTPVRTPPPSAQPTAAPTEAATASPAPTATPSESASPTSTPAGKATASASPSAVAVQVTPAPGTNGSGGSLAPLLIGAALVIVGLGAIAVVLLRRS